jgi:hypothetical protein
MAWSDEQKREFKIRLYLICAAALFVVPILLLGPLLPRVGKSVARDATNPEAPLRLLRVAQIQAATMRPDDAEQTLARFFELFADEDALDFSEVESGTGEWELVKHWPDGITEGGFTPWLFPEGKDPSAVVQAADPLTLGLALDAYGELLEDKKQYNRASRIYLCLANMWPENSEVQLLGEDGIKRAVVRIY